MSGRIPQYFIDELLARIDIVDIVNTHVPLKRTGKNYQACCPFHDEKTPSFTVSEQKQFYYCFGCGASGTAITFLMEYRRIGFVDAIEELAAHAAMEIPHGAGTVSGGQRKFCEFYELMEKVVAHYAKQLRKHETAYTVVNYLRGRGIGGEIAAEFELGFAPDGWDNVKSALGSSREVLQSLLKTGVVAEKDNGTCYDRFRNRLIFPIRDQRGRAIGLGGRVLGDDTPKYLNSPETPIFHKGRELYGLYQAGGAIKELGYLYIVEGYMDVIALAQAGIRNAVAGLGTAVTHPQIEKLFRITHKLVFCFDGDAAGRRAALRTVENALSMLREGRQVYFIFLPEGEDPDSFVRKNGKAAFLDEGRQTPLSTFLFDSISGQVDLQSVEGRAEMVNETLRYLSKLPVDPYRDILCRELGRISRYDDEYIQQHLSKMASNKTADRTAGNQRYSGDNKGLEKIRWLVRCLLHRPALAMTIDFAERLQHISSPGVVFLRELIAFIQRSPNITLAGILENWRGTKFENRLRELAADETIFDEIEVTKEVFLDAVDKLVQSQQREFEAFRQKLSPSGLSEEERVKYRKMQK